MEKLPKLIQDFIKKYECEYEIYDSDIAGCIALTLSIDFNKNCLVKDLMPLNIFNKEPIRIGGYYDGFIIHLNMIYISGIFTVYHPAYKPLNFPIRENIEFRKVASIGADKLGDVFVMAQNDFNEEYAALGIRSTSVGDVVKDPNGNYHMVMGMGYKKLDTIKIV